MVKRVHAHHRKQTASELRKKKKASHTAFQRQADFVHPSIRAAWDKRRTLQQNYVALGLAADPNDRRQRRRQSERLAAVDLDATEEEVVQSMTRKRKWKAEEEEEEERRSYDEVEGEEEKEESEAALTPAAQRLHAELEEVQRIGATAPRYEVKVRNTHLPSPFLSPRPPSHPRSSFPSHPRAPVVCLSVLRPRGPLQSMSLNEQRRLQRLIARHGEDVQAMARDIALNIQQETGGQLRKRLALYHRLQRT